MTKAQTYYKLVVAHIVALHLDKARDKLQAELLERSTDPVIHKRRFRMLSQLAAYESQIYKKIYNFNSDSLDDYVAGAKLITNEIRQVCNRSS